MEQYSNFNPVPLSRKRNLVHSLAQGARQVYSFEALESEQDQLRDISREYLTGQSGWTAIGSSSGNLPIYGVHKEL